MGSVHTIRNLSDAARMAAAAEAIRTTDCIDADDVADLLAAVAAAVRSVGRPPMTEGEHWRWSGVVMVSRRITDKWVQR